MMKNNYFWCRVKHYTWSQSMSANSPKYGFGNTEFWKKWHILAQSDGKTQVHIIYHHQKTKKNPSTFRAIKFYSGSAKLRGQHSTHTEPFSFFLKGICWHFDWFHLFSSHCFQVSITDKLKKCIVCYFCLLHVPTKISKRIIQDHVQVTITVLLSSAYSILVKRNNLQCKLATTTSTFKQGQGHWKWYE